MADTSNPQTIVTSTPASNAENPTVHLKAHKGGKDVGSAAAEAIKGNIVARENEKAEVLAEAAKKAAQKAQEGAQEREHTVEKGEDVANAIRDLPHKGVELTKEAVHKGVELTKEAVAGTAKVAAKVATEPLAFTVEEATKLKGFLEQWIKEREASSALKQGEKEAAQIDQSGKAEDAATIQHVKAVAEAAGKAEFNAEMAQPSQESPLQQPPTHTHIADEL